VAAVKGLAGYRTEPCYGGRHEHEQLRTIHSGPRCAPKAPPSTVHSQLSISRSSDGASVQVSAGRSCCSKTRLVGCAQTSDVSLLEAN
jgi:hypothetical protein